ncbi:SpoIIE family protein phosphatase [Capsulimonas corticalis]|nr:SpoIIE family protein phosphatase [Capsulimonas corticalis]
MTLGPNFSSTEPKTEIAESAPWRRDLIRYAGVVTSIIIAALVRLPLHHVLGPAAPFVTFFPAVVYSAWVLGATGGLFAMSLALAIVTMVILPATHADLNDPTNQRSLILFVAVSAAVSAMGHTQQRARRLTEQSEALKSTILQVAMDGIITIDKAGRIHEFNPAAEKMFGYSRNEVLGKQIGETLVPPTRRVQGRHGFEHYSAPEGESVLGRRTEAIAMRRTGEEFPIELVVMPLSGSWGHVAYLSDITDRKKAEAEAEAALRRESMLNRVSEAIRQTTDPWQVQDVALEMLAEALGVDRCLSIVLDRKRDYVSFVAEWRRPDLPDLRGEYSLSSFDVQLDEIFPASAPLTCADVRSGQFSEKSADLLTNMGIRALLDVPMSSDGEVVGVLGVYMADAPRVWSIEEIRFVEAVAAQLRSTAEAARLLADTQSSAERETLINRIGVAIRAANDPNSIQEVAVTQLGEALGADRCYFGVYDFANSMVTVTNEWRRKDLEPIAGVHPYSNTREMFQELYKDGPTSVEPDTQKSGLSAQTRANIEELRLRSRVSVALYDSENSMGTLTAAMSDAPRDWTPDEVQLIETVATQMRSAVEMARVQQREHLIAEQLQAALQPKPPSSVSGLDIRLHYKPALDEAGVGGDFYDVFSSSPGVTFLVVGDLSGKGLAAASQVATVRNMLRFALYNEDDLGAAVTSVGRTLSQNDLLTGFATLFVGRWDSETHRLSYVNCGQEPGLVRRASGEVLELSPTGPVLAMHDDAVYDERDVQLMAGDVLAVFTDGLTEVGPTRANMLGVAGVSALLQETSLSGDSEALVRSLIDEVNAYARGGVRDDQCLLVGAIEV